MPMPNGDAEIFQGWLDGQTVCKTLGVTPQTLRRWADAGKIRTIRTLGGHRRYSAEDLNAILRDGGPAASTGQQASA